MSKKSYKNMMKSQKRFNDLDYTYRKMVTGESNIFSSSINRRITIVKEGKDLDGKTIIVEKRVINVHPLSGDKDYEIAKTYDSKLISD